ncbi:MAG: hypothetical protein HOH25_02110, partial [Opitutae bacterium]|nr:hypothetical protein [Opitutae bacterium]
AQALHPAQLDAGESSPVVSSLRRGNPLFQSSPPPPPSSLAAAFQSPLPGKQPSPPNEVEPVVLGRDRWNDGAVAEASPPVTATKDTAPASAEIRELPPIETDQQKPGDIRMPLKTPFPPPAVSLHRNFEGKLVLNPRKLGYERDFPYQLLNAAGKRLAYVDVDAMRAVDPLDFRDRRVTILGKLEPVEEGSKNLIIRARLMRGRD